MTHKCFGFKKKKRRCTQAATDVRRALTWLTSKARGIANNADELQYWFQANEKWNKRKSEIPPQFTSTRILRKLAHSPPLTLHCKYYRSQKSASTAKSHIALVVALFIWRFKVCHSMDRIEKLSTVIWIVSHQLLWVMVEVIEASTAQGW